MAPSNVTYDTVCAKQALPIHVFFYVTDLLSNEIQVRLEREEMILYATILDLQTHS